MTLISAKQNKHGIAVLTVGKASFAPATKTVQSVQKRYLKLVANPKIKLA